MNFNNCTLNGDNFDGSRDDEHLESRSAGPEKRRERRLDFIRPVFYLCYGSNQFLDGTILNYSDGGLCLHTTLPVEPLTGIYLAARREKNASFYYKTGEYGFAKVVWCGARAGAYRVGIRWVGSPLYVHEFDSGNDLFQVEGGFHAKQEY